MAWHPDKAVLREAGRRIEAYLGETLDLRLKREPVIQRTRIGMDFLGFRVFGDRLVLAAGSKRRVRRKFRQIRGEFEEGLVSEHLHQQRVTALFARLLWPEVRSRHFREALLGIESVGDGHRPRTG